MRHRLINRRLIVGATALSALFVAAFCSPARGAISMVPDGLGDTFVPPVPGPAFDISSVVATDVDTDSDLVNDAIEFTINFFAQSISAPSDGGTDAVFGLILIDTDQNADMAAALDYLRTNSPPALEDIEFYIDLFSEQLNPTKVDLLDSTAANVLAELDVVYASFSLTVTAPYTAFNPDLVGPDAVLSMNFGAIVGQELQPTDQAPDLLNVIPEPGSLTLFGLGLACFAGVSRRRLRK